MNAIELEERLLNIEARIRDIFLVLVEYMETNPKADDQWVEARLRALEGHVKELRNRAGETHGERERVDVKSDD